MAVEVQGKAAPLPPSLPLQHRRKKRQRAEDRTYVVDVRVARVHFGALADVPALLHRPWPFQAAANNVGPLPRRGSAVTTWARQQRVRANF